MTTYFFDQIPASSALSFNAATDLVFGGTRAEDVRVTFDDPAGRVTVTDGTGRAVVFGAGVYGARLDFNATATRVFVGSPNADVLGLGALSGKVFLGGGDDTFVAGSGASTVQGGAGSDLFVYDNAPLESGTILGFEAGDRLHFGALAPTDFNYIEETAPDVATANTRAAFLISQGRYKVVVIGVAFDVHVYVDSTNVGFTYNHHVLLADALTLLTISPESFVGGPPPSATSPPPPPPPVPPPVLSPPPPPVTGTVTPPVHPTAPVAPATPGPAPPTSSSGTITGNMDTASLDAPGSITDHTSTLLRFVGPTVNFTVTGTNFVYSDSSFISGIIRTFSLTLTGGLPFSLVLNLDPNVARSGATAIDDSAQSQFSALLSSNDILSGGPGADLIRGYAGNDQIGGGGGADSLFGGFGDDVIYAIGPGAGDAGVATALRGETGNDALVGGGGADDLSGGDGNDTVMGGGGNDSVQGDFGNDVLFGEAGLDSILGASGDDTLVAGAGQSFLRGGDGNDFLVGDTLFDDMHGNVGNDTLIAGAFDDWVVGGQGNDVLFGDDGTDLCYGQLGEDTVDGGAGNDAVVGGQANDLLYGGAGDDFITGDRGDDTLTGGTGADTFHTNSVSGLDRVLDFNAAEGDRVLVDAGSTYVARQLGADTVVDMGLGNTLVLVNIQLSALPEGWITGG